MTTFGSSMDLLMQTAFAPMFHGDHARSLLKNAEHQSDDCVSVKDMAPVIELDNLEVRLGNRTILKRLNGSLSGRAIGLLGPNGAGKSTLINTLLGFYTPAAGTARIFGKDIRTRSADTAPADRVYAGERCVHRRHDRGAFRPDDGGVQRASSG